MKLMTTQLVETKEKSLNCLGYLKRDPLPLVLTNTKLINKKHKRTCQKGSHIYN